MAFDENTYILLGQLFAAALLFSLLRFYIEYRYLNKAKLENITNTISIYRKLHPETFNHDSSYLNQLALKSLYTIKLMLFKLIYIPTSLFVVRNVFKGQPWIIPYIIYIIIIGVVVNKIRKCYIIS